MNRNRVKETLRTYLAFTSAVVNYSVHTDCYPRHFAETYITQPGWVADRILYLFLLQTILGNSAAESS